MYNLVMKDLKLAISPLFFLLPVILGALMLIPGWLYFIVILYYCWITVPIMFGQFRAQNDLIFTSTMPITKKDIVKARVIVMVIMELLHIVMAMIFGVINIYFISESDKLFLRTVFGFLGPVFYHACDLQRDLYPHVLQDSV
ncbi:ABC-2 transporter permease [Paenibacillus polymyxa]|uniref:ABC-2 transporter permease n=1 Tax=Paenibacillus polymyxa TaxID=1406 RepID=UPI00288AC6B0|nr:ABC-2 transporter permease [Paenibacillus polymyxa]